METIKRWFNTLLDLLEKNSEFMYMSEGYLPPQEDQYHEETKSGEKNGN